MKVAIESLFRHLSVRTGKAACQRSRYPGRQNDDVVFVGKLESKRSLGRPRCRWEIILKLISCTAGYDGVHWIHVAQARD